MKDLIAARIKSGGVLLFEADAQSIEGLDTTKPTIHFTHEGKSETLECDFIAGCDGFHGISRPAIPEGVLTTYDRIYPFGWLGILSESPPLVEMTYANHERGFALASRRSPQIARLYVQCAPDENLDLWPDARIWDELHLRLGDEAKSELREGKILQKGVTPCRSFVSIAHAVRPAVPRGRCRAHRPADRRKGTEPRVRGYSRPFARPDRILPDRGDGAARPLFGSLPAAVWKAVRFSNYMTSLLHKFDTHSPFDRQIQLAELDYISGSQAAQKVIAENYVGLPFQLD